MVKTTNILVIDGGSKDRTIEIINELDVDVIIQKGSGKGYAISQALDYLGTNTVYVGFIDGDYTYPAKHLKEMVKLLEDKPPGWHGFRKPV